MKNRPGYHRLLAISIGIGQGTSELFALQRAYLLKRIARLRSSWA